MKTAVEWLHELSKQRELDKFDWQQAKEMEKEQMSLCYKVGVIDGNNGEILKFENYYKETFKSE